MPRTKIVATLGPASNNYTVLTKMVRAGLDVVHGEWSTALRDHPLIRYARTHENLLITPHVGGVTFESQAMTLRFTAEKLRRFLIARNAS